MNVLTSEDEFERVRKFYGLLEMKPQDILSQVQKDIAENSNAFSLEEIKKVLEFLSPNKKLQSLTAKYLEGLYTTSTKIQ